MHSKNSKIALIEITFVKLSEIKDERTYFERYSASNEYLCHLSRFSEVHSIKFAGFTQLLKRDKLQFYFFSQSIFLLKILQIIKCCVSIKSRKIFIIQGFKTPHLLLLLQFFFRQSEFYIWHHAELPSKSWFYRQLLKWQNRKSKGFIFNGRGLAFDWIEKTNLPPSKILELPEASTHFQFLNSKSKKKITFIWIGRLIPGKQAIYFLKSLESFVKSKAISVKIHFVYQDGEQYNDVLNFIRHSGIKSLINLHYNVETKIIEQLLNDSHYFVSASQYEGSGYALIEALACGCLPIVSDIPAFRYLLSAFPSASFFEPYQVDALYQFLINHVNGIPNVAEHSKIRAAFDRKLTFQKIAESLENQIL